MRVGNKKRRGTFGQFKNYSYLCIAIRKMAFSSVKRRRYSSSLVKNNIGQLHESYNNIINIFNLLFENLIY